MYTTPRRNSQASSGSLTPVEHATESRSPSPVPAPSPVPLSNTPALDARPGPSPSPTGSTPRWTTRPSPQSFGYNLSGIKIGLGHDNVAVMRKASWERIQGLTLLRRYLDTRDESRKSPAALEPGFELIAIANDIEATITNPSDEEAELIRNVKQNALGFVSWSDYEHSHIDILCLSRESLTEPPKAVAELQQVFKAAIRTLRRETQKHSRTLREDFHVQGRNLSPRPIPLDQTGASNAHDAAFEALARLDVLEKAFCALEQASMRGEAEPLDKMKDSVTSLHQQIDRLVAAISAEAQPALLKPLADRGEQLAHCLDSFLIEGDVNELGTAIVLIRETRDAVIARLAMHHPEVLPPAPQNNAGGT